MIRSSLRVVAGLSVLAVVADQILRAREAEFLTAQGVHREELLRRRVEGLELHSERIRTETVDAYVWLGYAERATSIVKAALASMTRDRDALREAVESLRVHIAEAERCATAATTNRAALDAVAARGLLLAVAAALAENATTADETNVADLLRAGVRYAQRYADAVEMVRDELGPEGLARLPEAVRDAFPGLCAAGRSPRAVEIGRDVADAADELMRRDA